MPSTLSLYTPKGATVTAGRTSRSRCSNASEQNCHDTSLGREAALIRNLALPVVVIVIVSPSGKSWWPPDREVSVTEAEPEPEASADVVASPPPAGAVDVGIEAPPSTHCEEPVHLP